MKTAIAFLTGFIFFNTVAFADPVHNITTGVDYTTIQAAINAASAGNIIAVDAGTYTETITINKNLTLRGPNAGIDPNNGTRVAEAIILNSKITVTSATSSVIIDGFTINKTGTDATHGVDLTGTPSATSVTIQNNIFNRNVTVTGSFVVGVYLGSAASFKTIRNNLFTGSNTFGSTGSHKTWRAGIWSNGGKIVIENNVFEKCNTDINFDNSIADVTLEGNTFRQSGTGIALGPTPAGNYTFGANEFGTNVSTIVNNSSVDAAFRLDITAGSYGGTGFASQPLNTLFTIDGKIEHRLKGGNKLGLVYFVANNIYVSTSNANIQNAISYAKPNDIITVQNKTGSGTYSEYLTIDKPLTLQGQSQSGVKLNGSFLSGNGSGIVVNNSVKDVVIQNLTIQGYKGTAAGAYAGVYTQGANDHLSIKNLNILNNTNADGISLNGGAGISIETSTVQNNVNGISASGGDITISNNVITGNTANGILLSSSTTAARSVTATDATAQPTAAIHDNSITSNGTYNLNNQTAATTDATCNWWGSASGNSFASTISGNVSYVNFLNDGTNTQTGTLGFQPADGTCEGTLPVSFGDVSADISDGALVVQWTTLWEKECSHFDIEGSADGIHFTKLGTVATKALNGNSDLSMSYSFTKNVATEAMLGLSFVTGIFMLFAPGKKNQWAYILIAAIGLCWAIQSCSKNERMANTSDQQLYVRIVQVDVNGSIKYSKIIKVVKEQYPTMLQKKLVTLKQN